MAVGARGEVGKTGNKFGLPWGSIPEDMKYFRNLTTNKIVIMGSSTFGDCGSLPDRANIVCSRDSRVKFESCKTMTLEGIKVLARDNRRRHPDIFVIGGPTLAMLLRTYYDNLYITRIDAEFEADTYIDLPDILSRRKLVDSKSSRCPLSGYGLRFELYK